MDLVSSNVRERNVFSVKDLHGNWVGSQATILYQNKLVRERIELKVEQFFKEIV